MIARVRYAIYDVFSHLLRCNGEEVAEFLDRNRKQRATFIYNSRILSFELVIKYRSLIPVLKKCIDQRQLPIEICRFCKCVCAASAAYRGLKAHFDDCSFVQMLRDRAMSIINAITTENAEQIAALMPEGSDFEQPVSFGLKYDIAK